MSTLSKSKILSYLQCPKRLWLEVKQPELVENSAATEASFKIGHQVGEIARTLYDPQGNGVLIAPLRVGFETAFSQTENLLKSSAPIFEAAITTGDALALADVMLPMNLQGTPSWRMIEVKSSTSVKDYHRDDVAVQAHIARSSGVALERIDVACIDNQWVYPGEGNYQGLLKETDLTEQAFGRTNEVKGWIEDAHKMIDKGVEPNVSTGPHCNEPYSCGFYQYCSGAEPQPQFPVNWLPDIRKRGLKEFIRDNGVTDLGEVPDDLLNERQRRVKKHSLSGKLFFDKEGAATDLAGYELPAYFLDFETINLAVPIWKGRRAYQQVPFQYSLHKLSSDSAVTHESFLDLSGKDPAEPLADKLVAACGQKGPIFVYNIGFESARIRELAEQFPRIKQPLLAINSRLVDLMVVARKRYYHPGQQGSWSIKKVLPAIAPDLDYEDLEGVQDGGSAMAVFSEAIAADTSLNRKSEIEAALLAYCRLDTVALVRLWSFFTGTPVKID
jgi:CRISPR/Cas system-associated exonuclease Cas4 (RecB family)